MNSILVNRAKCGLCAYFGLRWTVWESLEGSTCCKSRYFSQEKNISEETCRSSDYSFMKPHMEVSTLPRQLRRRRRETTSTILKIEASGNQPIPSGSSSRRCSIYPGSKSQKRQG